MRKILKIILIVFVVLAILILGFLGYTYLKQEYEISKLPDYYRGLAEKCEGGESCCMRSVEIMAEHNYELIPEEGCPEGFRGNGLECIDSYAWCEPMPELACETDSDCVFYYTAYSKDNLCPSCFYADKKWVCMNKEKAKAEMNKIFGAPYRTIPCEKCFETDYDLYSCKCLDNICRKLLK